MGTMTKLGAGGKLVLPLAYRRALGVSPGDDLVLLMDDGEVRLLTPREATRRAQALVRRYIPAGRRLADELIAERRRGAPVRVSRPSALRPSASTARE